MKIDCPPGMFTDRPPLSASPFWFFGDNVRFRQGIPETIGLFAKAVNITTGEHLVIDTEGSIATIFGDGDIVLFGYGTKVTLVDWQTGDEVELSAPLSGTDGRWWFVPTEEAVFCGRSNFDGKTYVINRTTRSMSLLSNAPTGGVGAGVLSDILLIAGTLGVAGAGPKMIVRWSARTTDDSSGGPSGPVGFEDWTPSDVNSSGEVPLDEGKEVRASSVVQMGYAVWTDTSMFLLTPRTDLYVFTSRKVSSRGILSSHAYCEADGRIWWYDQSAVLNVFDGGGARQVVNPMQHVSVETLESGDLGLLFMSANPEHGEVSLHYPDTFGRFRELVYNYIEDAWYPFTLDRVSMTDAQGSRPSIGIDLGGRVFFYDLSQELPYGLINPIPPAQQIVPLPPPPLPSPGELRTIRPAVDPEPFSFRLITNWIGAESYALESLRSCNVVVSHTLVQVPGGAAYGDQFTLTVCSYGSLDLNEVPLVDAQTKPVGDMLRELRAGGKAIQFVLSADAIRTKLRFGALDVDAVGAGKR